MASGRSYLCHSKPCAALIASAISRSEFMRHKTHAELWRATPHSACSKNNLIRLVQKIAKTFLNRVLRPPIRADRSELVRLAVQLIIEEVLGAEARDKLGRERYERAEGEPSGRRNGYRTEDLDSQVSTRADESQCLCAIIIKAASISRSLPRSAGLPAQRCRTPIARFAKPSRSAITVIM
jgi:Transposase, Mutator family